MAMLRTFTVLDVIIDLGVNKAKPRLDIYALHVASTHSL